MYVWNNNVEDQFVNDYLRFVPNCKLVVPEPGIELIHVHADPLQRLYEMARSDGCEYVITLDSDAHPLNSAWLPNLIGGLERGAALAGVYRDELSHAIEPYIHASCLATSVSFVEEHGLRYDYIAPNEPGIFHDTLSSFTAAARDSGSALHPLHRSNERNFHRLMGGIYGDLIYHHGAGSRPLVDFWDEAGTNESRLRNRQIGDISAHFLYTDYDRDTTFLMGGDAGALSARLHALGEG